MSDFYRVGRQLGKQGQNASVQCRCAIAAGVRDGVDEQAGQRAALIGRQDKSRRPYGIAIGGSVAKLRREGTMGGFKSPMSAQHFVHSTPYVTFNVQLQLHLICRPPHRQLRTKPTTFGTTRRLPRPELRTR